MSDSIQISPELTTSPENREPARTQKGNGILLSVQSLAATVVIAVFVITFILQAFQIPSESMENTLLIGDYLLVDKVHYGNGGIWGHIEPYSDIRRGDIIVFRFPLNPSQHFVKRVIGLPGDHVRLINKRAIVNGRSLREPYVIYRDGARDPYRDDFPDPDSLNANVDSKWWLEMRHLLQNREIVVPQGRYFVLGDNRDQSLDSRYWGFVPRENIIGRPLLIYWSMGPAQRIGPFSAEADTLSDRVIQFTHTIGRVLQETRWNRTFRLIK